MSHATFSPSSAVRWINCAGSMAFPENLEQGGSSTYADDGTASHEWASDLLLNGHDATDYLGSMWVINNGEYVLDEDRAGYVQMYVDDVRRRAMGGHLFVEHRVKLPYGEDGGGTLDAGIYQPETKTLIIEDLKYGMGVKVYAERNAQLMCYAIGMMREVAPLGDVEKVVLVVCQPRLWHIDEWECSLEELMEFDAAAVHAVVKAENAIIGGDAVRDLYLNPADKTCQWCRAKARCPALAAFVTKTVRQDFEDITVVEKYDDKRLSQAVSAVPLIFQWCNAVQSETFKRVAGGIPVIGSDGKPFKIVEGRQGDRKWRDEKMAEYLLATQLGERAYAPRKVLSAAQAAKILDKGLNKAMWADVFTPLITRAPGKPQLALGSDERPAFSGAAVSDDFEEIPE